MVVLVWGAAPLDGAIGAPARTEAVLAKGVDDPGEGSPKPPHPVGVEDAWVRTLGPHEGTPQAVYMEHGSRRVHAFDLPSREAAVPEVRTETTGDRRIVWAYLHDETRLGVSVHDRATGKRLGDPLLVEGETFVEELSCGGLVPLNDLVVILERGRVRIGMRFASPLPDESELVSVLVYPRPGTRGRLMHLRRPADPRSRLHELGAGETVAKGR